MADELSVRRMLRCARTIEGHQFTDRGTCVRCGLTVHTLPTLADNRDG